MKKEMSRRAVCCFGQLGRPCGWFTRSREGFVSREGGEILPLFWGMWFSLAMPLVQRGMGLEPRWRRNMGHRDLGAAISLSVSWGPSVLGDYTERRAGTEPLGMTDI